MVRQKFSLCLLVSLLLNIHCLWPIVTYAAPFKRGDVNGNSELDVTDIIRSLEFLFLGAEELDGGGPDAGGGTRDDGYTVNSHDGLRLRSWGWT